MLPLRVSTTHFTTIVHAQQAISQREFQTITQSQIFTYCWSKQLLSYLGQKQSYPN